MFFFSCYFLCILLHDSSGGNIELFTSQFLTAFLKWQKNSMQILHLPVKLDSGSCREAYAQCDWRRNLRIIYGDRWYNGNILNLCQISQNPDPADQPINYSLHFAQHYVKWGCRQRLTWLLLIRQISNSINNQTMLGERWLLNYYLSILTFYLWQHHQIYAVRKLKSWALNLIYWIPQTTISKTLKSDATFCEWG